MTPDAEFASRLREAILEAEKFHDGLVNSDPRLGSKGELGLQELSGKLAKKFELQEKRATRRWSSRFPQLGRHKIERLKGKKNDGLKDKNNVDTKLTIQELVIIDLLLR